LTVEASPRTRQVRPSRRSGRGRSNIPESSGRRRTLVPTASRRKCPAVGGSKKRELCGRSSRRPLWPRAVAVRGARAVGRIARGFRRLRRRLIGPGDCWARHRARVPEISSRVRVRSRSSPARCLSSALPMARSPGNPDSSGQCSASSGNESGIQAWAGGWARSKGRMRNQVATIVPLSGRPRTSAAKSMRATPLPGRRPSGYNPSFLEGGPRC